MTYEMGEFGAKTDKPNTDILMGLTGDGEYYQGPSAAFSAASLKAFADDFLGGKLSPYVKPDEPPTLDDEPADGGDDGDDAPKDEP